MDKAVSDVWWKNAIVYCLDVETFLDSDGDGVGDFRGLTRRLEYLDRLGVTCIWLLPCFPTANRDDGYDVTDYYSIDPRFGTLGDFVEFVRTADGHGIRVIIDLVVNHTSVEHPWFQDARDPASPRRDWYVWADEPLDRPKDIIFPDVEDSNWKLDEASGQYYLHRFYREQPDLNVANPEVRDEINRIIGFWMQMGVSGFRVDAVPYLIGEAGIRDEFPDEPHSVLRDMRRFMARRRGDAVMFGEVNLDPGDRTPYFGEHGDEMTGLFNFILAGSLFHALVSGSAEELAGHLRDTPRPPEDSQWLSFVRNHDELNLSRLPDAERETVLGAVDPEARIFDRGVRRRVPPLVDGDERRTRLLYSAMLAMPGTPVLLYGEEIGMGDDLSRPGRMAVRTPMQWSSERNAGFSRAEADQLVRPLIDDGLFAYDRVNVTDQRHREDSMLNWMQRALRVRTQCPEVGWGGWDVLDTGEPSVLAHRCNWLRGAVVAFHNFADRQVSVSLAAGDVGEVEGFIDLLGDRDYDPLDVDDPQFDIEPFGYRWVRAHGSGEPALIP